MAAEQRSPEPAGGGRAAIVDWLASESGAAVLARAAADLCHHDELYVAERLGAEVGPARAAAVLTQVELRRRAVAKFSREDAGRMLFTPAGLEQATRGDVATYRATLLAARLGPRRRVLDLGCGIGADLIAFARAGFDVTGVEAEPVTAATAQANLATLGLHETARACRGDATTDRWRDRDAAVFADPARRDAQGRVFDAHGWSPPWPIVLEWLTGTAAVKVGPGIPHRLIPPDVGAEWISVSGAAGAPGGSAAAGLKEALLTSGAAADPDGRFAATVQASAGFVSLHGDPTVRADPGPLGSFLYEPDPAVIRAGLVGELAGRLDGRLLDRDIAYLTTDATYPGPFARGYRILEVVPHRPKRLRALLRARRVGQLTIKKRGVDVDPARLRRDLLGSRGYGSAAATLVLTRTGGRSRPMLALLVAPLAPVPSVR